MTMNDLLKAASHGSIRPPWDRVPPDRGTTQPDTIEQPFDAALGDTGSPPAAVSPQAPDDPRAPHMLARREAYQQAVAESLRPGFHELPASVQAKAAADARFGNLDGPDFGGGPRGVRSRVEPSAGDWLRDEGLAEMSATYRRELLEGRAGQSRRRPHGF